MANSSRVKVRQSLFQRVLEIGERRPDLDSDAVLSELERGDRGRRQRKV